MPRRHAGSHALATFATMIAATAIGAWMRHNIQWLVGLFDRASSWLLQNLLPVQMSRETLTNIIFAMALSALWGLGFYHLHRDR